MKIMRRVADFCGTKEKREENETMISMGKRQTPFSSLDLLSSFSPSFLTIFTEKGEANEYLYFNCV
jgi:hypothetical protein